MTAKRIYSRRAGGVTIEVYRPRRARPFRLLAAILTGIILALLAGIALTPDYSGDLARAKTAYIEAERNNRALRAALYEIENGGE